MRMIMITLVIAMVITIVSLPPTWAITFFNIKHSSAPTTMRSMDITITMKNKAPCILMEPPPMKKPHLSSVMRTQMHAPSCDTPHHVRSPMHAPSYHALSCEKLRTPMHSPSYN